MNIAELISPQQVVAGLRVGSKRELLRELAKRAAKALAVPQAELETALGAREEMGSTGTGQGVAVPHARLAQLDRFYGLFARLAQPIDFQSVDELPVDLVFLLLSPEKGGNDHLAALAAISRRLRDPAVANSLRSADNAAELYRILTAAGS